MKRGVPKGLILEHQRVVRSESPATGAFWESLFSWAALVPQIVLVDPLANLVKIRHVVAQVTEKRARAATIGVFDALLAIEHGKVMRRVRDTPFLAFRPSWPPPGINSIVNATVSLPCTVEPFVLQWRQSGKHMILLTERAEALRNACFKLSPDAIQRLYGRFPSNSFAQDWFARAGPQLEHVKGKPRTLSQLGKIRNAELRRVLVQIYGVVANGRPIQRDDYGQLYEVDETTRAVHVTCPSTGREYWLGVPATCVSAREAVLWTFGIPKNAKQKLLAEA